MWCILQELEMTGRFLTFFFFFSLLMIYIEKLSQGYRLSLTVLLDDTLVCFTWQRQQDKGRGSCLIFWHDFFFSLQPLLI